MARINMLTGYLFRLVQYSYTMNVGYGLYMLVIFTLVMLQISLTMYVLKFVLI